MTGHQPERHIGPSLGPQITSSTRNRSDASGTGTSPDASARVRTNAPARTEITPPVAGSRSNSHGIPVPSAPVATSTRAPAKSGATASQTRIVSGLAWNTCRNSSSPRTARRISTSRAMSGAALTGYCR